MAYYLEFIQLGCIVLTFGFAFDPFESLPKNFSRFQNGSKFWNFGLGDGESWKSQYRRYLYGIIFILLSFSAKTFHGNENLLFWVKKIPFCRVNLLSKLLYNTGPRVLLSISKCIQCCFRANVIRAKSVGVKPLSSLFQWMTLSLLPYSKFTYILNYLEMFVER